MSTITRPTKASSGTTEYQAGTTIFSGEVNADFDTIYGDYDGNIDNSNIAAGANIAASKLNLTNAITTGDLQDGAVTTAKIANAPNGVTLAKLTVNVTAANNVVVGIPANTAVTTSETTLIDTPSFTSRGSATLVIGTASFVYKGESLNGVNTLTVKVYTVLGGVEQAGPVTYDLPFSFGTSTLTDTINAPVSLAISFIDSPTAAATTLYRVKVLSSIDQVGPPLSRWFTVPTNAGFLTALQLA